MPSKGSWRVTLRLPGSLRQEITEAMLSANLVKVDEPFDFSGWIKKAIQEKLDHLRRSRKPRKRKDPLNMVPAVERFLDKKASAEDEKVDISWENLERGGKPIS